MSNKHHETGNKVRRAGLARWPVLLTALAIAAVTFATPPNTGRADAHPLGNFSINRLSIIEITGDGAVNLTYLVDMAEIPAFQAREALDPDGDGVMSEAEQRAYLDATAPKLVANLALNLGGEPVDLEVIRSSAELIDGQGGLKTARIAIDARGDLPADWQHGAGAGYEDHNFAGTNGWRQVIVRPGAGVDLFETSAPVEDVTQGLRAYPQDLLSSAPAVTNASFRFRAGESSAAAPVQTADPANNAVARDEANRTLGRFASLVATEHLTPAVIALALVLSAAWGAMHALGPGHGKTVVAAYLVGERGTGRHAVYLGLIVTATHTISVFALGAIAIFASNVIAADDIYYWLSLGSGLVVVGLGSGLLVGRGRRLLRNARGRRAHASRLVASGYGATLHVVMPGNLTPAAARPSPSIRRGAVDDSGHSHGHGHSHDDGHHHEHAAGHDNHRHDHGEHGHDDEHGHSHVPAAPGWRGIVALGVAGGIVPCPTALVVMLGAIALDRAVFGIVMVTAFSAGLAGVLTGIGLLMVYGKRWLEGRRLPLVSEGLLRRAQLVAPVLSALGILSAGLLLTSQALL